VQAVDEFGLVGEGIPVRIQVLEQDLSIASWNRSQDGTMTLEIAGSPGQILDVEVSPDMNQWFTRQRLTNATGRLSWGDPEAALLPHRFYRLKWLLP